MNKQRYALCIGAAGLAVVLAGCESLNYAVQDASGDVVEAPVSRARVVAELREAQRLGLIPNGEQSIPEMSAEQARLIAEAGDRADANAAVASK
jgi:hypothetical protein